MIGYATLEYFFWILNNPKVLLIWKTDSQIFQSAEPAPQYLCMLENPKWANCDFRSVTPDDDDDGCDGDGETIKTIWA